MKIARLVLAAIVLISVVATGISAYTASTQADCPSCEVCP